MQPDIHLNYLAILAAMAANIAIGFAWYGPLFGRAWITASTRRSSPGSDSTYPSSSPAWRGRTSPGSSSASTPATTSRLCWRRG
jgi:hypothetical protein